MSIDLHIDELVLHGVASTDRDAVVEALRQVLVQRLEQRDIAGFVETHIPRLDAPMVRLPVESPAVTLGEHIGFALSNAVAP